MRHLHFINCICLFIPYSHNQLSAIYREYVLVRCSLTIPLATMLILMIFRTWIIGLVNICLFESLKKFESVKSTLKKFKFLFKLYLWWVPSLVRRLWNLEIFIVLFLQAYSSLKNKQIRVLWTNVLFIFLKRYYRLKIKKLIFNMRTFKLSNLLFCWMEVRFDLSGLECLPCLVVHFMLSLKPIFVALLCLMSTSGPVLWFWMKLVNWSFF